jgi:hypothetical protein
LRKFAADLKNYKVSDKERSPMFAYLRPQLISRYSVWSLAVLMLCLSGCSRPAETPPAEPVAGCDGQIYIDPAASPYVLPFAVGETFETGLTNCSSSYHGPGEPDQYAFDFDTPLGTSFSAARAGTVFKVVEDEQSMGGGVGNYVIIDHHDGTYGLYYHSPENGIDVAVGDEVVQGDVLGKTGRSGLAGYPHLHFIVVEGNPSYPYQGIAISFRNASPADVALKGKTEYEALPY